MDEALARGVRFQQGNFATEEKYPFETLGGAAAALDYDDDGWLDLLFLDGAPDVFTLFVNQGKGFFLDRTFPSGIGLASTGHSGWSMRILDVDNDGAKDLFVAGSHVVDNVGLYSPEARYEEVCFLC